MLTYFLKDSPRAHPPLLFETKVFEYNNDGFNLSERDRRRDFVKDSVYADIRATTYKDAIKIHYLICEDVARFLAHCSIKNKNYGRKNMGVMYDHYF